MTVQEMKIETDAGQVSALLNLPGDSADAADPAAPAALLVLAHGAGAGMRHRFMTDVAEGLEARGVGTLRYQFPYMEAGGKRTDRPAVAHATVRAAVAAAASECPGVPLFAGGKSFGGRMTSQAAADDALPDVLGLVFFGFPLHPPGRPGTDRADHLADVRVPMLFLQGTRDSLAGLDLLRPVLEPFGDRATLHIVDGGDHSFHVPKRSGRTDGEAMTELLDAAAGWMLGLSR